MFILCKKLKLLKGSLRSLNSLHFSHISERVARAEKALNDTQLLLQNDMDNGQLLALEKLQRLNLVNLKSAEKMFFSQKLKCAFFKECDKGSRFFHSLFLELSIPWRGSTKQPHHPTYLKFENRSRALRPRCL